MADMNVETNRADIPEGPVSKFQEVCDRLQGYEQDFRQDSENGEQILTHDILTEKLPEDFEQLKDILSNNGDTIRTLFSIYVGDTGIENAKTEEGQKDWGSFIKGIVATSDDAVEALKGKVDEVHSKIDELTRDDKSIENLTGPVMSEIGSLVEELKGVETVISASDEWKPLEEKCLDVTTANMEKIPDEIKERIAATEDPNALFVYGRDEDGNVDRGRIVPNNDLSIKDNGMLADSFGISLDGKLVDGYKFEDISKAREGLEARLDMFNEISKANGGKVIFHKDYEVNSLKAALVMRQEGRPASEMTQEMNAALKLYAEASQNLHGVSIMDDSKLNDILEKAMIGSKIDSGFEKTGTDTGTDTRTDSGAFTRGETVDFDDLGRQDRADTDEGHNNAAIEAATASSHGRSIVWELTGNENTDKYIAARNEYITSGGGFPTYRMNPGYLYADMRATLSAAHNRVPINGKVPGVFECYSAINSFVHFNMPEYILLSLIDAVARGVFGFGEPRDKVDDDGKGPNVPGGGAVAGEERKDQQTELKIENVVKATKEQFSAIQSGLNKEPRTRDEKTDRDGLRTVKEEYACSGVLNSLKYAVKDAIKYGVPTDRIIGAISGFYNSLEESNFKDRLAVALNTKEGRENLHTIIEDARKEEAIDAGTDTPDHDEAANDSGEDDNDAVTGDNGKDDEDSAANDEGEDEDSAANDEKDDEDSAANDEGEDGDSTANDEDADEDSAANDEDADEDSAANDEEEDEDSAANDEEEDEDSATSDEEEDEDSAANDEGEDEDSAANDEEEDEDSAANDEGEDGDSATSDEEGDEDSVANDGEENGDSAANDDEEDEDAVANDGGEDEDATTNDGGEEDEDATDNDGEESEGAATNDSVEDEEANGEEDGDSPPITGGADGSEADQEDQVEEAPENLTAPETPSGQTGKDDSTDAVFAGQPVKTAEEPPDINAPENIDESNRNEQDQALTSDQTETGAISEAVGASVQEAVEQTQTSDPVEDSLGENVNNDISGNTETMYDLNTPATEEIPAPEQVQEGVSVMEAAQGSDIAVPDGTGSLEDAVLNHISNDSSEISDFLASKITVDGEEYSIQDALDNGLLSSDDIAGAMADVKASHMDLFSGESNTNASYGDLAQNMASSDNNFMEALNTAETNVGIPEESMFGTGLDLENNEPLSVDFDPSDLMRAMNENTMGLSGMETDITATGLEAVNQGIEEAITTDDTPLDVDQGMEANVENIGAEFDNDTPNDAAVEARQEDLPAVTEPDYTDSTASFGNADIDGGL